MIHHFLQSNSGFEFYSVQEVINDGIYFFFNIIGFFMAEQAFIEEPLINRDQHGNERFQIGVSANFIFYNIVEVS